MAFSLLAARRVTRAWPLLVAFLLFPPTLARADDRLADDRADAVGRAALEAHAAGQYADALALFEVLESLRPSPRNHRAIAMCAVELGDLERAEVALIAALEHVDRERPLDDEQRAHAAALLSEVRSRRRAQEPATPEPEPSEPALSEPAIVEPAIVEPAAPPREEQPLLRPTATSVAVRTDDQRPLLATPLVSPTSGPAVIANDGNPALLSERRRTSAPLAHLGATLGAHDGGTGLYGAAGLTAVVGWLTRATNDFSIGGTAALEWSHRLEDAGSASQTATWFALSVRLSTEIRTGGPWALAMSLGVAAVWRSRPGQEPGNVQPPDAALEAEIGPRLFVVDELLFIGADLRGRGGPTGSADLVLLLGLRG